MGFVQLVNYYSRIRKSDFDKILSQGHAGAREENETTVEEEVSSYLRRRYDVTKIIWDIPTFVLSNTTQLNELVIYTESAYVAATTYAAGDRVSYSYTEGEITYDNIYESLSAGNIGNTPNTSTSDWQKITENNSYYVCRKQSTNNAVTDAFAYSTNNYTSRHENILGWDRATTIYFKKEENVIRIYLSSADRTAGVNYVGEIDYTPITKELPSNRIIEGGVNEDTSFGGTVFIDSYIPDDTEWDVSTFNYFEKKDTRNKLIVRCFLDMVIYELHSLISPRNVPEYIVTNQERAEATLVDIQKGNITLDAPVYEQQPKRGTRITIGHSDPYKFK